MYILWLSIAVCLSSILRLLSCVPLFLFLILYVQLLTSGLPPSFLILDSILQVQDDGLVWEVEVKINPAHHNLTLPFNACVVGDFEISVFVPHS